MKGEARVVLYFDISRALAELVHVYVGGGGLAVVVVYGGWIDVQ